MDFKNYSNSDLAALGDEIYAEQRRRTLAQRALWRGYVGKYISDGADIMHFIGAEEKGERCYLIADKICNYGNSSAHLSLGSHVDATYFVIGGGNDRWRPSSKEAFESAKKTVESMLNRI
jgi:hypothetical protein